VFSRTPIVWKVMKPFVKTADFFTSPIVMFRTLP
jgi:hypothetical protein